MANRKRISAKEKAFAWLVADGLSPQHAAIKVFGWKCETYSTETTKAYNLAKTVRVKDEIESKRFQLKNEADVEHNLISAGSVDREQLRRICYQNLEQIADDPHKSAKARFDAIKALEKLSDPSTDMNLIWRWIDIIWRGGKAHCPGCHNSFPLWKIDNPSLQEYRVANDLSMDHPEEDDDYTRRMELIAKADLRKRPHPGQVPALEAPERHLVLTAAARSGKSYLLGLFAYMAILLPGIEVWVLSRVYEEARSEVEFLRGFIKTLFYPYHNLMVKERFDHKSGEMTLTTRWGSELKIKSAKAPGSITGRELEMCLVAEPAWVPNDLYEEVRARMSSRLGRILAFGTPKGYGGFLSRMVNIRGVDPETGKYIRIKPEDRLIKNGAKWTESMLVYHINPVDNPEYVKSELEAARKELTEEEYASEFRGEMVADEGAKYPHVKEYMLRKVSRDEYEKCAFIQGIDQGPRNFGAIMCAYDGEKVYMVREYYDNSDATIKANLLKLRKTAPMIVQGVGGHLHNWKLTILDNNPQPDGIISEMATENTPWPTECTYKHVNKNVNMDDWREETSSWINQMAAAGRMVFDEECDQLLWQVMEVLNKPRVEGRETKSGSDKGWVVRDPYRGDHVLDAWLLAMWTIFSNQIELPEGAQHVKTGWEDHKAALEYRIARDEKREIGGYVDNSPSERDLFKSHFGREKEGKGTFTFPNLGNYDDA